MEGATVNRKDELRSLDEHGPRTDGDGGDGEKEVRTFAADGEDVGGFVGAGFAFVGLDEAGDPGFGGEGFGDLEGDVADGRGVRESAGGEGGGEGCIFPSPAVMMGSTAMTRPSVRTRRSPGAGKFGMEGSSCTARPTP